MASCNNTPRLSISSTSASVCGTGNGNCNNRSSAIECCDSTLIGPRKKRDNVKQQLHDYILLKLGAPVIEIELDEQQIDLAIDEALDVWENYAPREFYQYYTFATTGGKSVYEMPPEVGLIRQVYYREMPTFGLQASDLGGVLPIEYAYNSSSFTASMAGAFDPVQPMYGNMGTWTLYKQYNQMFATVSSSVGGWEWVGGTNTIKLYPIPCRTQHVIVHYLQKCKDWACNYQSIREGALASAMMMVGEIRSKFSMVPNPGGGVQLNGQDILQRGRDMWDKWEQRLIDRYGDILPITTG